MKVAPNLMQLRRLVRSRMGVPLDDDFMSDSVLDDHINLACQSLDAEAHWPWTDMAEAVTLTSTSPDIVPAMDWRATRSITYQKRELALVAPADLLRVFAWTSDVPTMWSPVNDLIAVRPKPNHAVEVIHHYYRQCMWMVEDGDTPMFPHEYTGAIVAKAAELLSARESSGGDAARHGTEYTGWVTRMRRDMRRSTGPVTVRVRPGGWV